MVPGPRVEHAERVYEQPSLIAKPATPPAAAAGPGVPADMHNLARDRPRTLAEHGGGRTAYALHVRRDAVSR